MDLLCSLSLLARRTSCGVLVQCAQDFTRAAFALALQLLHKHGSFLARIGSFCITIPYLSCFSYSSTTKSGNMFFLSSCSCRVFSMTFVWFCPCLLVVRCSILLLVPFIDLVFAALLLFCLFWRGVVVFSFVFSLGFFFVFFLVFWWFSHVFLCFNLCFYRFFNCFCVFCMFFFFFFFDFLCFFQLFFFDFYCFFCIFF